MLFFLGVNLFYSQNFLDSLSLKIRGENNDSVKINIFYQYALADSKLTPKQSDSVFNLIFDFGKKSKNKNYLAYSIIKQGHFLDQKNLLDSAILMYFDGLNRSEKLNYRPGIIFALNRLGNINLKLNKWNIAKEYFFNCLFYLQNTNNDNERADCYSNLGTVYKELNKIDSSLYFHFKALNYRLRNKNQSYIAISYNNIGLTYKKKKDYDKALEYLYKALDIRKNTKKIKGYSGTLINIGNVLILKKKEKEAINYLDSGIFYSSKYNYSDFLLTGLKARAECLAEIKLYKESSAAWAFYEHIWDSINTSENQKIISELQSKYESNKKDANLKLQEEQIKTKTSQNSKQKIMIIASIVALFMSLIAVFFIYRSFRANKKNAIQLAFKNHLIEEKNKEITDSINYARLIQQSLLASEPMLNNNLKEYFILYKPKDIVSGDFYWAAESQNGFLIACVDCTGHGVPGAFMSLIGKENLDKAVVKTNSPKQLLQELNNGVKKSLNQNSSNLNRDGMDAAIVRIEKELNGISKVYYSGANRPIWIIKKAEGVLEEIKATKQAIGGFTSDDQEFVEHELLLKQGDSIFISTDGFADQFGSDKNKKMTTKRFKNLLLSVNNLSSIQQKQKLENFFDDWKGSQEQLDDLLVIGIKI